MKPGTTNLFLGLQASSLQVQDPYLGLRVGHRIFSFVPPFFLFLAVIREHETWTMPSTVGIIDNVWSFWGL